MITNKGKGEKILEEKYFRETKYKGYNEEGNYRRIKKKYT